MSKGSQTTTTTQAPPANVSAAYNQLISNTQNLAQTPYTPFTGEGVAAFNPQEYQGVGTINSALPYYGEAGNMLQGAATPLSAAQIEQYYNPYQQQVIGTTEAQFANTNAQQQQQVLGNAAAQGALGGDRTAVAQSVLAGQQQAQEAPVIAGLEQQGYNQALSTAASQFQQNPEAIAYGLGNVGAGTIGAGSAELGAGTAEQQTQQAQDTYAYQQYLAAMGYPYAQNQYAAGIIGGIGSESGGTGTTVGPPPSSLAQDVGLGIAGIGAVGNVASGLGALGYKPFIARGGRIKGYQGGGAPSGPIMPYAGGPSYIPAMSLVHGRGPPSPPSVPKNQSGGVGGGNIFQNANQLAQSATGLTKGLGAMGVGQSYGDPSEEQGGGRVNYPGGLALPGHNRIQLPMRAGMGMPSFVPRRGYDGGGSPSEEEALAYGPGAGGLGPTAAYAQSNPYVAPQADDSGTGDVYNNKNLSVAQRAGVLPGDQDQVMTPVAYEVPANNGQPLSYAPEQAPSGGGVYSPPAGVGASPAPMARPQTTPGSKPGFLGVSGDAWNAIMAAGLGVMASARPGVPAGAAIGEGGLEGLQTYAGEKKSEADVEFKARQLDQQAKAEADRVNEASRPYEQMTAAQKATLEQKNKYQEFEMSKPVPSGTAIDQFGNRIQTYSQIGPDGKLHPLQEGSGVVGQPGTSTATGGINPNLHGDDYLKQFPPETQQAVKDYLAGRTMPTGNPRAGPVMMIKQIAQKYGAEVGMRADDAAFAERRQMLTDLARTSPQSMGGQLTFAGTAISHLADGADAMTDLHNYDVLGIPALSTGVNMARGAVSTGQQSAVNRVNGITQHFGQEVTKYYANSPGGEAERNRFNQTMNPTQSPVAAAGSIRAERDLIPERTSQQYANMVHVLGQQEADAQISRLHVPEQTARINASIAKLDTNGPEARGIADGTIAPVPVPATVKDSAGVKAWAQQNRVPSGYPIQLPDGSTVRAP